MLCNLYEETAEFFKNLQEDVIVKPLQEKLGDFMTSLKENMKNIKPQDQYVILVAGNNFLLERCLIVVMR